ncbi:MAG: DUF3160 domain-containing protein [Chloroflexota bacterium]
MQNKSCTRYWVQPFSRMNHCYALCWFMVLSTIFISTACAGGGVTSASQIDSAEQIASVLQSIPQPVPFPQIDPSRIDPNRVVAAQTITDTPYLESVDIVLDDVKYLSLVEGALPLNDDERDRLTNKGFVVSDRYNWERFLTAYAWIYWKDLPVLVTTDAILHAFHQSYVDILADLERSTLKPQLAEMLETTRSTLAEQQEATTDADLVPLYVDVDSYLAVATHLLQETESEDATVQHYVTLATDANEHAAVELFVSIPEPSKSIDFTLFEPRAQYAEIPELQGYFRAMSWLGLVDFRFVAYDPETNDPILDQEAIAAAAILRNAIDETDQRLRWGVINDLLELFIGPSDNTTLSDFDRFLADADLAGPAEILAADEEPLMDLLTTNDYGQQRITGQLLERSFDNSSDQPIPRPTSFLILGQRFALDSFVFSELVHDRIIVNGFPVKRALPSPLDAMAALGSSRARIHLEDEISLYQYEPNLDTLAQTINDLPETFWQAPIYNQWLGLFRTLNTPSTSDSFPQAMRTSAWADKMLQTQLGSWAQMRHDNLLYVKQSFTPGPAVCEYPAGYVEPYPDFYAALKELAQDMRQILSNMPIVIESGSWARHKIISYLDNLEEISNQLQILAEKELRLEEFTRSEELFLKSMVRREYETFDTICSGMATEEYWDGWYVDLFYEKDDNPALIADVHTNPIQEPLSALYPPRVLHAATGPAVAQFLIVDTDESATMYVGPAFSYFEVITEGDEHTLPERLNDQDWRTQLADEPPPAPSWTQNFRLSTQATFDGLQLPEGVEVNFLSFEPWIFLPLVSYEDE